MRCDLHVHSVHSGRVNLPLLGRIGNECYSEPRAVLARCRALGLDLVTLTDHDTIAGALEIGGEPDVFVSEELTLVLPGGRELHLGILDIDERKHERLGSLRCDPEGLFAFCAEERIPVSVNHPFAAVTGPRRTEDFQRVLRHARLIEARNGMLTETTNRCAERAGETHRLAALGGSDAHTMASIGRAYTQVPGARNKEEYLAGLRRGWVVPKGRCGSYAHLTADVVRVFAGAYLENARQAPGDWHAAARLGVLLLLAPLLPSIPLFTAFRYFRDPFFALTHLGRYLDSVPRPPLLLDPGAASPWGAGAAAGSLG